MKKSLLLLLAAIAGGVLYFLYLKGYLFVNFDNLSPREAYALIRKEPTTAILDVRTPQEYAQGHLPGAKLIPLQQIDRALGEGALASLQGKKIVVYCRSGMRSALASRKLADHGLHPCNVRGGINAWRSEGLPIAR